MEFFNFKSKNIKPGITRFMQDKDGCKALQIALNELRKTGEGKILYKGEEYIIRTSQKIAENLNKKKK